MCEERCAGYLCKSEVSSWMDQICGQGWRLLHVDNYRVSSDDSSRYFLTNIPLESCLELCYK